MEPDMAVLPAMVSSQGRRATEEVWGDDEGSPA